ncbi:MAG: hypothetical protein CMH46_08780 [Muricauda sp.]|nr:hypothetical protein [Allomuricauda sp.]MAU15618.1 hypothetical protein [Allomuricauda sp.]|tara:strand:- start:1330 stop:2259 length:930 start_codon:yes stop_codon:yes gene_type:complete
MKLYTQIVIVIVLSLIQVTVGCKRDVKEKLSEAQLPAPPETGDCPDYILKSKENNLNISVFLDLSDRITEAKTIQKDTQYLKSIAKAFTDHVKTKKLILLQDRIQLYFNPEPANEGINSIAEKLHIEFNRETPKSKIEETNRLYAEEPIKLYGLAQADSKQAKDYPGSDIWRFFKDNVKDYTISTCHRNILVILTDGYMYHKDTQMKEGNKSSYLTPKSLAALQLNNSDYIKTMQEKGYGFIPANDGLEDLEVLVIGVQSSNTGNPYAIDIIREYWTNWFEAMGIKKYKIQNADLASSVEKVILGFIHS